MKIPILLVVTAWLVTACREPADKAVKIGPDTIEYKSSPSGEAGQKVDITIPPPKDRGKATNCEFKDGTHPATVEYYNPRTGHTAKYELKVQVEGCQVIQINFPNGGWLDEDHIPRTSINSNGEAVLEDDKGRRWEIHFR